MKLPISFEEFKANPVAGVAFCMLLVVGYLYVDLRSGYTEQIDKANKKIDVMEIKVDKVAYALKRSDSALSAAITELRIINTVKKL